jgi:hypothetical protein
MHQNVAPIEPMAVAAENGVGALLDLLDLAPGPAMPTPTPAAPEPEPQSARMPAPRPAAAPAAMPPAGSEPSGENFVAWLHQGVQTRKLVINDAKALVHTVAGTAYLVSPGIFQRYAQEHLQVAALAKQDEVEGWQWVQKRFEKLGQHRKQASGLNIWTCEVTGPRKSRRLHGYLLEQPDAVFGEVPPDNPYLRLATDMPKRENPAVNQNNNNDNEQG